MNAQAAHLVDHVLPTVPLRQWVLTVPFEIRALLAFDPKLLSLLRRIYVQETLRFFEAQLASTGVLQPRGGAVNFAHRVDGALRINPLSCATQIGARTPRSLRLARRRPQPTISRSSVKK
jgi:hypothetical protein